MMTTGRQHTGDPFQQRLKHLAVVQPRITSAVRILRRQSAQVHS
jgi:hypothetical protein